MNYLDNLSVDSNHKVAKMSDNLSEAQVNEELEKSFLDAKNEWKGVIVFEHLTDRFLFMPIDGFPMGETFEEQCPDIDLTKKNITIAERMQTFKLKVGDDDYGADARLFLRVEVGKHSNFMGNFKSHYGCCFVMSMLDSRMSLQDAKKNSSMESSST